MLVGIVISVRSAEVHECCQIKHFSVESAENGIISGITMDLLFNFM